MNLFQRKGDDGSKELGPVRSDPFESMWSRLLASPFGFESRLPEVFQRRGGMPAMNVSEDEQGYEVTVELPGLDEKDIEIQLMGNQLVISGERKWHEEKKEQEFHRVESQYGSFQRSVTLPDDTRRDGEAVEATYKKGVLTVRVPKVEPTPARKIKVQSRD